MTNKLLRYGYVVFTLAFVGVATLSYVNCSRMDLAQMDSVESLSALSPNNKTTLAVRGGACIMCHAQVEGDVVTDFGLGQPYFLSTSKYEQNFSVGWNTPSITGNVIVPNYLVKKIATTNLTPPKFIKDILGSVLPVTSSTDLINVPGSRGGIVAKNTILIGTPNEDVISNLTRLPNAINILTQWDVSLYKIGGDAYIRGLVAEQSQYGDYYFTNDPAGISCSGDIVILGPVVLDEANIQTTNAGCRLYVQKSVFIKGGVTYNGSTDPYPNLQISSARAIIMGIKGLSERLDGSADGYGGIRAGPTADTEKAFNQLLIQDRDKVISHLEDAGPWRACKNADNRDIGSFATGTPDEHWEYLDNTLHQTATYLCATAADWTFNYKASLKSPNTRHVSYQGLFLNAPKVHSRYLGVFKGVVVAEDAMFALNEFVFQHDDTFNNVVVLPLMKGRILQVSDD